SAMYKKGGDPKKGTQHPRRMVIIRFADGRCCGMGHGVGHAHRLTSRERSELQRRVRAGETHKRAAAAVGCSAKSVQRLLAKTGGIKSRAKPRSPLRLSLAEREEISRGLLAGESRRVIAARLGRAPSTVAREVTGAGVFSQNSAARLGRLAPRISAVKTTYAR